MGRAGWSNPSLGLTQAVLESAPDGIVIVNRLGQIQLVNAATETLFGYDREELLGKPVEILIPERFRSGHPRQRDGFFEAQRNRPMGAGLELSGRRKDGAEFSVEIALSPLHGDEDILTIAAVRDVTDRKRAETELRAANLRLEAASRAKDNFLARMSHELRTPLNAILGFAGTLLMELPGPLNDSQAEQLRTVETSGRRLLAIISNLLDLSKIEAGDVEVHFEDLDLSGLIADVVDNHRMAAADKSLELELASPTTQVIIRSDQRLLAQVVTNLLDNAIRFTDQGGVRIEIDEDGEDGHRRQEVRIIDTGRGIRDEDRDRVFAAFERLDALESRASEGAGLGLHLSQRLAQLLGAQLSYESEFGRGSTFTVRLGSWA